MSGSRWPGALVCSLALSATACGRSVLPPIAPSNTASTDAAADRPSAADGPVAIGCASPLSVTFRLQAPAVDAGVTGYAYSFSFGDPGDGIWWYSVAKADGTELRIFYGDDTPCGSCGAQAVPIGLGCGSLPAAGVTAIWNGDALTSGSTCTSSPDAGPEAHRFACDQSHCVPAGQYVVTMCASPPGGICLESHLPDAGTTCVSVRFDYPTSSEVVGTLPPAY